MSRPAALRGCPCTVCLPQGCGPGMPGPYAKRPPFDKGGQTVEKGVLTPWPPLRGGSARRRWGRELYGCPKYFGLWQGSLPPPLRGTAPPLAQAPPPPYRGSLSRRGRFFDRLDLPLTREAFSFWHIFPSFFALLEHFSIILHKSVAFAVPIIL